MKLWSGNGFCFLLPVGFLRGLCFSNPQGKPRMIFAEKPILKAMVFEEKPIRKRNVFYMESLCGEAMLFNGKPMWAGNAF